MRTVCTLILLALAIRQSDCQCTFPGTLVGTWTTSGQGTWIVNSTHIQNYETISDSGSYLSGQNGIITSMTMMCLENRGGTKYVLQSETFEYFAGTFITAQVCIDFEEITDVKYVFYKATSPDPGGDQWTLSTDFDTVCDDTNYRLAYRYRMALKSGSETTALTQCPSSLFGSYNYDTCADPASNTSVSACDTRMQLIYNYTQCTGTQMFSLEGVLDCVYFLSSGTTTYLTMYNRDNTAPNMVSTYRFVCLALTLKAGGNVDMTVNPQRCAEMQNSSAIASPGYAVKFSAYFLCPLTTATESSFDIIPIIAAIIGVLLLIAIAIIIYCCCRRRCAKKRDEENDDRDSVKSDDSQDSARGGSRRESHVLSRRSSRSTAGSKSSLDSGIEELKPTPRTDPDDHDGVNEDVIHGDGDREEEDKTSRPASGQLSRMSDLPPSSIAPEDEVHIRGLPDEDDEEQNDDVKSTLTEIDETAEDNADNEDNPPAEEQEEQKDEQSDKEGETKTDSEEEPGKKSEEENVEEKQDTEPEPEKDPVKDKDKDEPPEEDGRKKDGEEDDSDDDQPGGRRKGRKGGRHDGNVYYDSDGNELHSSDSEYQRRFNKIGRKGGRHYQPGGPLTTVLVSREEDEKKRGKHSKTKKQKTKRMTKLARKRTRKPGDKGGNKNEDGFGSSDEEWRLGMEGDAAFMRQYREKKRLEHILDEQHYWSDPEEDRDPLARRHSGASTVLSSELDEDDYEIIVDENGVARRVKKNRLGDDDDDEYETIIDENGVARRVKKNRLNDEDGGGTGGTTGESSTDRSDEHLKKKLKSDDKLTNVEDPEHGDDMDDNKDDPSKTGQKYSDRDKDNGLDGENGAKLINVKGQGGDADELTGGKRRGKGYRTGEGGLVTELDDGMDNISDVDSGLSEDEEPVDVILTEDRFTKQLNKLRMDNISDVDSGLSEDEEPVDVILTEDQQQMIVNMLFDEDMNLRPQFDRDEEGRIIRRLDGSVIYDPHTGRFTFLRRLGQLFKIPRLKRNDKGRPTGGYIMDDYGPKEVPKVKGDSGKRGRIGSGRTSGDPSTASPSADQKRSRTMDGKNVGFNIPEDDLESMNTDQLEYHKRGRRDISSAIRRSLNRRLFRKKRKRGKHEVSPLPDVQLKKSWTGEALPFVPGSGDSPHLSRTGRGGSFIGGGMGTPGQQRKHGGGSDLEQLQRNREGLEHDRKILERHYKDSDTDDSLSDERPWDPRNAYVSSGDEDDLDDEARNRQDMDNEDYDHGLYYRNADGRLVIRERGCPDLKHHPHADKFFTVVRRRRDLENEEVVREMKTLRKARDRERNIHTAPALGGSRNDVRGGAQVRSDESLDTRANSEGRMSSIDDSRLRRLLEELYRDKKYLDHYIDVTEPKSVAIVHSQGLAEHGRGYLLERADYWEQRGPLPPRPPQTDIGWRMQRQQTMWSSRESQMNRTSTTMTYTPTQTESVPGTISSPRDDIQEEDEIKSKDGSVKFVDDPKSQELKESEA